jgi:hypothetical protein
MAWVQIAVDTNTNQTIWAPNAGATSDVDQLRTTSDGVTLETRIQTSGGGTQVSGSALTVGTWYHIAVVRESTTSLKVYINGALDITNTRNVGSRTAITRMEIGAYTTGNTNPGNIRVAYQKAWSAALTAAEVAQEMYTVRPRRLSNLYGWWPGRPGSGERAKDYSGNGRDWTEGGTLTDEDPPPIPWGAGWRNRAKTGTQYSQSTAGTLTSSGALAKRAGKGLAGTLSSSGALVRQARKLVAGTLTSAGSLIKQARRALAGTLTSSGALATSRIYIKALAGTLTSIGALTRQTGKALTGTLTSSGTANKRTSKSAAGTLIGAGALATARVYLKVIGGTLTSAGALVLRTGKSLAGTLSSSGALIKQSRKLVSGALTSAGAVVKQTAKRLAGTLTSSGTVVISRLVAWVRHLFQVPAEDRTSAAAVGTRFAVAREDRTSTVSRGADFSVADDDRTSET